MATSLLLTVTVALLTTLFIGSLLSVFSRVRDSTRLFVNTLIFFIVILVSYPFFQDNVQVEYKPPQQSDGKQNIPSATTSLSQLPAAKETEPQFETDQQRNIYGYLKAHTVYTQDSLPSGSKVDQEPLKTFIEDLARVLYKTKLKVEIEVHTDRTGRGDPAQRGRANQDVSRRRAEKIEEELLGTKLVVEAQIKTRPLGDSQPVVKDEKSEEDQKKNRRVVVRRLD